MDEVNLHDTPPFIFNEGNVCVSRTGDVIFCYELILPERHSLSESNHDELNTIFVRAFKNFEKDTVIHQCNFFAKRKYNTEGLPEKSYLQKTFKAHHSKKSTAWHGCYLFFSWTLSDIFDRDTLINPFSKLSNEKEILDKLFNGNFPNWVENAVTYVNSTKKAVLQKLNTEDIEAICRTYFNGLLHGVYTDTEKSTKGQFKVGGRLTDIYTLHSLKQLPKNVRNVTVDPELSDEGRKFMQGITEPFGFGIPYDHLVNQIIFIPAHSKIITDIQKKQSEFFGSRNFGLNKGPAENLEAFLRKVSDESVGLKLVKAHFNVVVFTDNDKERDDAKQRVRTMFTDKDISPYEPNGNALRGMFVHSFFGFSARIPSRFNFICDLEMACSLMMPTSGYRSDKEGLWFTDRIFMAPIKRDTWDDQKRRIKARNFFIIAPTGQGKSTLLNHMLYQWLDSEKYKVVLNDLGKSAQNVYRMYKHRSVMLDFVPGLQLGINPFFVEDPAEANGEMILYLNNLINLFHFKGNIPPGGIPQGHDTCIRAIINSFYENADEYSMATFYKWFQFVHKENRYEAIGVDPGFYEPTKPMGEVLFSLSEFGKEGGLYNYLFQLPKDDRKIFRITPDVDFAYFEFDRAGEDSLLQAILQQYSYQATRKVIWEDKSVRGVQIYDEYAKQLKSAQVQASSEYIAQAIRKQNGSCGFVIQSVAQLPKNDTIGSILDNTSVFYILPTDKTHKETADRLQLPEHQRFLLDSIQSNFTGDLPYSEVFMLIGKYATVVRNQLPREHWFTFQTEGHLYDSIERIYENNSDMAATIEEIKKMNIL